MKNFITFPLAVLLALHFIYSISNNIFSTWHGYLNFYNKTTQYQRLHTLLKDFATNKVSRYISHYTGAETGFGFFAPNVLSSSVIVVEKDGKLNLPVFSNHENELRFNNLASSLTRDMLKRLEGGHEPIRLKKAILGKYTTARDADSAYTNLILKNLAVPYMDFIQNAGNQNFVSVKVLVYDYPSLAECAANKNVESTFIPLYITNILAKSL